MEIVVNENKNCKIINSLYFFAISKWIVSGCTIKIFWSACKRTNLSCVINLLPECFNSYNWDPEHDNLGISAFTKSNCLVASFSIIHGTVTAHSVAHGNPVKRLIQSSNGTITQIRLHIRRRVVLKGESLISKWRYSNTRYSRYGGSKSKHIAWSNDPLDDVRAQSIAYLCFNECGCRLGGLWERGGIPVFGKEGEWGRGTSDEHGG